MWNEIVEVVGIRLLVKFRNCPPNSGQDDEPREGVHIL